MNSYEFNRGPISSVEFDVLMGRARAERAEAMRKMLVALWTGVKGLAAHLRPDGVPLPQAGTWALRPRPNAHGTFA